MPQLEPTTNTGLIEPSEIEVTKDEALNGWTKETLTKYLNERNAMQSLKIDIHNPQRRKKPSSQNHSYNVHRWRR